jgi:hypothetical protein
LREDTINYERCQTPSASRRWLLPLNIHLPFVYSGFIILATYMRSIDNFYLGLKEPTSSCLAALRVMILRYHPGMSEALKYGMPFFSFNNKMLCYFWINKKTRLPYISFKDAQQLPFPWLEHANRTRFSIMNIDPYQDLPVREINQTLKACIALQNSKTG